MKLVRFLGVAGLAMAVAPQASAVPLDGSTSTICLVAGSLNSCASVAVSVSGSVLTAVVGNVGGNASYALAGFAFFYTGTSTATGLTLNPSPVLILGNAARDWGDGIGLGLASGNNGGQNYLGGSFRNAGGSTGAKRIFAGESATFKFDIAGSLTGNESNIFFAFRGQDWDGPGSEDSFKCRESSGSTPDGAVCEPGGESTVPEPATMALLATGLVGMGGATMLRRRRKNQA